LDILGWIDNRYIVGLVDWIGILEDGVDNGFLALDIGGGLGLWWIFDWMD